MPFLPIFSDPRLVAPKPPRRPGLVERNYVAEDRAEAQRYIDRFIAEVDADHSDRITVPRDVGCLMRDEIERLRRFAASRLTLQAPEKDIVIEKDPRFNDAVRIDGILVSTEALLYIFRPNPDPRMWSRFERTPSPTHPGEDVITVHVETREG